jgi:broad specificity phosphatase PhoE
MSCRNISLKVLLVAFVSMFFIFCTKATQPAAAVVTPVAPGPVTTIIVVRHAEKDPAGGNDPALSAEGTARAERLSASFPGVVPDSFYSTNYIRTKSTLAPWATQVQKSIQMYDANALPQFAELLKKQPGKTIVVAGHSNTVPPLVNYLIGENKYSNLQDSEYDKIFVVTLQDGKGSAVVKTY